MRVETIGWHGGRRGHVRMIDQTLLPERVEVLEVATVEQMVEALRRLAVRGAPAIGLAAAYGVLLGVQCAACQDPADVLGRTQEAAATLARARPTAVNLFWALDRMVARATRDFRAGRHAGQMLEGLFDEAETLWREDRETNRRIGELGAELIADGSTILTHCNAGTLAATDYGTALAPVYVASEQGKRVSVIADETRPLLQGARLTAWELGRAGIDVTLVIDSCAARVMFEGKVDAVFVGADRIARNGDVANKIGTYGLAVLAREHGLPFYVCAPLSTFDPQLPHGDRIPIEERPPEEVTEGFGRRVAPAGVRVYNPAFDLTPARLVTAIVTEAGVVEAPDADKIEALLRRAGRLV